MRKLAELIARRKAKGWSESSPHFRSVLVQAFKDIDRLSREQRDALYQRLIGGAPPPPTTDEPPRDSDPSRFPNVSPYPVLPTLSWMRMWRGD